jgi:hypothetical protein
MESSREGRSGSDRVSASLVRALHGASWCWLLQRGAAGCLTSSCMYYQQVVAMVCTVALCAGWHFSQASTKLSIQLGHSRLCSRADRQQPGKVLH